MIGHTGILLFSAGMDVCLLSVVGWTLKTNHTQTHIHSQHDKHIERLSCLDMLVIISITSWAANPATRKQIFPAVWFLDCSSLFSHYAPLCVVKRGEGGSKQTLDLSSGVISSLAKRRPAITCHHVSI